jgi:hypothetical protein
MLVSRLGILTILQGQAQSVLLYLEKRKPQLVTDTKSGSFSEKHSNGGERLMTETVTVETGSVRNQSNC